MGTAPPPPPPDYTHVVAMSSDLRLVLDYLQRQWVPQEIKEAMNRLEQRGRCE